MDAGLLPGKQKGKRRGQQPDIWIESRLDSRLIQASLTKCSSQTNYVSTSGIMLTHFLASSVERLVKHGLPHDQLRFLPASSIPQAFSLSLCSFPVLCYSIQPPVHPGRLSPFRRNLAGNLCRERAKLPGITLRVEASSPESPADP